jgi:hypothetical protein
MNTAVKTLSTSRYLWLFAFLGLTALAWLGVLDNFSSDNINHSMSNAGLIYGTARGINALVSLLQGTELNFVILTISIGEALDPLNDLIERFSQIILFALGSLALQKILLALVSHTLFNVLLTIVAVSTGLCLFIGSPRLLRTMLRAFLAIAFFRFSLGLVVLANGWVDTVFLQEADQQRHIAMENFQGTLRELDMLSKQEEEATAQFAELHKGLTQLHIDQRASERDLQALTRQVEKAAQHLDDEQEKGGQLCRLSPLSPTCPEEVTIASNALTQLEHEEEEARASHAGIEAIIEDKLELKACLEKRQRGEKCSFWEGLPDAPNPAILQDKINELNVNLNHFAETCIDLLMSLLLKTVAIPLFFLYLLLKILRLNWAKI